VKFNGAEPDVNRDCLPVSMKLHSRQWPEDGYENGGDDPKEDVQREADFHEIHEAVTAFLINVGVRLVSDRFGEAGAGTGFLHGEHSCDGEQEAPRDGAIDFFQRDAADTLLAFPPGRTCVKKCMAYLRSTLSRKA